MVPVCCVRNFQTTAHRQRIPSPLSPPARPHASPRPRQPPRPRPQNQGPPLCGKNLLSSRLSISPSPQSPRLLFSQSPLLHVSSSPQSPVQPGKSALTSNLGGPTSPACGPSVAGHPRLRRNLLQPRAAPQRTRLSIPRGLPEQPELTTVIPAAPSVSTKPRQPQGVKLRFFIGCQSAAISEFASARFILALNAIAWLRSSFHTFA